MNEDIQVCPKCRNPSGYKHYYLFFLLRPIGRPELMTCECGYIGFADWMTAKEFKDFKANKGKSRK